MVASNHRSIPFVLCTKERVRGGGHFAVPTLTLDRLLRCTAMAIPVLRAHTCPILTVPHAEIVTPYNFSDLVIKLRIQTIVDLSFDMASIVTDLSVVFLLQVSYTPVW